ncbi:hypothetical protein C826_00792 [Helicobacter bilis WiWa]|uniref:Outer membrane protein n=2 Tax=Helicobacter bilis TaxID=37372 RepID=N2BIH3_9HELI|nr:hypothetical protein C826_00792 [Helicobacter bilis WiWa]
MVLELEGFLGSGSEKALNQLIFGVSQDIVLSIPRTNLYAGVGIGIYIRTLLDSRMNSAFTFGEKVFIGYNYTVANKGGGGISCEIFVKHYSNGDLTPLNKGFNFFGASVGYSF